MDQEKIMKANFLSREIEQLESNLELIDQQINELQGFVLSIDEIEKAKNQETLSSLGKGVYVKSKILEKEFFVEVGAGVVVKKSRDETKITISDQISRLREAKAHLISQLNQYSNAIQKLIQEIQQEQSQSPSQSQ